MTRAKLPETIREKVKNLYEQGYDTAETFDIIKAEALLHLQSEEELRRCLRSLKGKAGEVKGSLAERPDTKEFDAGKFESTIKGLQENTPGKEIEAICLPIAQHILKKHEGFARIERGPSFRGTPFDLFGFKNGMPYIIEMKASLDRFQYPGETQKWRLQELLRRNKKLRVALLQLAVQKGRYRIFYDDELAPLFFGSRAPLRPIEDWIRQRFGKGV